MTCASGTCWPDSCLVHMAGLFADQQSLNKPINYVAKCLSGAAVPVCVVGFGPGLIAAALSCPAKSSALSCDPVWFSVSQPHPYYYSWLSKALKKVFTRNFGRLASWSTFKENSTL